jgi:hypothetical protein
MLPPKKLRLLRGMRRSGNHALMQWIVAQSGWVFFNDIVKIGPFVRNGQPLPAPEGMYSWLWRRAACFGKGKLRTFCWLLRQPLMFGLEDHALDFRPFANSFSSELNILILRSPANMFASRLQRRGPTVSLSNEFIRTRSLNLWKSYASEFIGRNSVLTNKVCICYDLWFICKEYRQNLAERLGVPFSDAGRDRLAVYGGGSSFDGSSPETDPRQLSVLRRFAQVELADRELLRETLSDPALSELWGAVVGSLSKYPAAERLDACNFSS